MTKKIRLKRREFAGANFFVAETERNYAIVNIGKKCKGNIFPRPRVDFAAMFR